MATNITKYFGEMQTDAQAMSAPAAPNSGEPVLVYASGRLTGIALVDEGDGGNASTDTTYNFGPFMADVSVEAVDDDGNSAVAVGDKLYINSTDAPTLNKKASGVFYGYAQATVTGGSTATISVFHVASADIGTINAADLSTTLKTGFLDLGLVTWREVASDDIQNLAAHGGILAKDSTPILEFTNGDTDSAIRLNWASSNSNAITLQTALPPDLDTTNDLVVHMRAAMGGATDTPVIDCDAFFNEGDTKVSDASAAITGATVAEYTITIGSADVPAGAQTVSIELTPAAHTTDALFVYSLWLEYTRA